jgi:predicted membrane channel-forming protein YqfA (hemolysin III family)
MEVTYQLAADDFYDASNAHRKSKLITRWGFRAGIVLAVLLLAFAAVVFMMFPDSPSSHELRLLFVLGLIWLLCVAMSPLLRRWALRRQFRGSPSAQSPITLRVSDDGLHFHSNHMDGKVAWSSFVKWHEGKSVFALMSSPVIFHAVPKRAFTPEALAQFRETLRQRIRG